MAKEICISSTPHETRLAILEDDQLAEIYYERENEYTLAGSIYNGKVTRVLPGMQSAFVDIGLERDAFLYVTDFLELEDPEESDEIEKAAVSGGGQAPREVRQGGDEARGGRSGQKPEQKSERKQERASQERPATERSNQDRPNQERRGKILVESAPDEDEAAGGEPGFTAEPAEDGTGEAGEPGAKRWRGRRRRRGGRGGAGSPEGQAEPGETQSDASPADEGQPAFQKNYIEEIVETETEETDAEVAPLIHAGAASGGRSAAPRREGGSRSASEPAPAPFVMPGESLSRYGGTPAASASVSDAAPAKPARPASSFKPATLIEAPLGWDGSGLLPGETLSKHRKQPIVAAEPVAAAVGSEESLPQPESAPESVGETVIALRKEIILEEIAVHASEIDVEEMDEEYLHPAPALHVAEEGVSEGVEVEPEADASASHNVDPLPPAGFRLFGLGGKKKTEEPAAKSATKAAHISSYAPGSGLIEEETIEEEEFDAPRHAHRAKGGDHESDDFDEETFPAGLRGALGDEDEDEEPGGEGQPVAAPAPASRRDRSTRNRRGGRTGGSSASAGQGGQSAQTGQAGQAGQGGQTGQSGQSGQNGQGSRGRGPSRRSAQLSDLPIISDLLKPGQEILVQIAKEPIAKKGARITSHIALPGRFLVFMPTVTHIGVSRKIESDEERQRLKRILVSERGEASGGFIVRTAAEGASEEELRADLRFLLHLWAEIKTRSDSSKSPALIYHDLSLIERILRDQVSSNFSSIWVDSQEDYERIVRFLNRFSPSLVRRVKMYTKETPLFEHFGIQDEISKALRSKVWLKSGGSIVINQTEALVAIDINTGKYVGKSARLEDTIVKTNLDAVPEIVRQIRLRDLGGIIVIDFIDMDDRKNRYRVMAALEEALKADRAPTKVLQFNDFGLVAITRKRVKQSLERTLSVPCPTCQATGMVKSPATVCNEIYTELRKMKKHFESADVLLRVNPETVKTLKSNNGSWLTEFEELVGKNILVKSDATLHPEQFDIQG